MTNFSKIKPPINWKPPDPNLIKEFGSLIAPIEVAVAKPYSFRKAKTIKQAEDYARDELGITEVSYKDMNLEGVNVINERLHELFETLPQMKGKIGYVGNADYYKRVFKHEISINAIAVTEKSRIPGLWDKADDLIFNERDWKNTGRLKKKLAKLHKDKWLANGELGSLVDHEFGHAVQRALYNADRYKPFRKLNDFMFSMPFDEIAAQTSRYGAEYLDEFWAEMFAKYKAGKSLPLNYEKMLKTILKEVGKI